jgi:hypothetical protein
MEEVGVIEQLSGPISLRAFVPLNTYVELGSSELLRDSVVIDVKGPVRIRIDRWRLK